MILFRIVGLEFRGGDYLRQKYPVTKSAADQICVLTDESQSCPLCQIALEQRACVNIPKAFRAGELVNKCDECFLLFANDIVVIGEPRVTSHDPAELIGRKLLPRLRT